MYHYDAAVAIERKTSKTRSMAYTTQEETSIKSLFQPENAREAIKARVILKKFEETLGKLSEINRHKPQREEVQCNFI